jgi:outer membrane protein OmpA-like peptidoglycan-associated protein
MNATRVEIVGYRGAALLSDGTVVLEKQGLAQRRAEQVAELLRGAGLTTPRYAVRWMEAPPAPDGGEDYRSRRVEISLLP